MSLMTYATELNKSAQKYRKQLLQVPSIGLTELIPYMTGMPGVTYKQTVGEIFANSQLRPYDGNVNNVDTTELHERTLETFLGSLVELFDPNALRQTLYAQLRANVDSMQDPEMNKAMLFAIMDSVMSYLGSAAWNGVRNASGTTTKDLFNGFDTLTATEIAAATISEAIGNLTILTDAITNTNAFDVLRAIWKAAPAELRQKKAYVFLDPDVLIDYEEDYMTTVGATPYNTGFNKKTLEGTGSLWEFVPMVGKVGSGYIHVSTKQNMLYGYGAGVENETIEIRRGDNPFKLQFILAMFFGVQFATLNKKELFVAQLPAGSGSV